MSAGCVCVWGGEADSLLEMKPPRLWGKSPASLCQRSCGAPALMSCQPRDSGRSPCDSGELARQAGTDKDPGPAGREQVRISSRTTGGLWAAPRHQLRSLVRGSARGSRAEQAAQHRVQLGRGCGRGWRPPAAPLGFHLLRVGHLSLEEVVSVLSDLSSPQDTGFSQWDHRRARCLLF